MTEVLFEAKNMREDAEFCHQQAMRMMMMLNDQTETSVTPEQSFVVAAIVAPEFVEEGPTGGAVTVTASCLMLLFSALVAAAF